MCACARMVRVYVYVCVHASHVCKQQVMYMHAHTSIKMCSCINRQLHLQICQGDTFCGWLNCPIGSLPTLRVRPSRSGSLTLAVFVQFQHRFGMGTRHSQPTVCNEAVGCRWDVQPDQLDVPACPDQTLSPLWHNNEHAARTLQPHSMRPAAAGRSTCKCACVCVRKHIPLCTQAGHCESASDVPA